MPPPRMSPLTFPLMFPTSQMAWSCIRTSRTGSPLDAYQRWASMWRGSTSSSRRLRSCSAMRMRQGTTRSLKKETQPSKSTRIGTSSDTIICVCHDGPSASEARRNQ